MEINGLLGLIIFILDIFAIIKIAQSSVETIKKAIWIVVVLVLPLIGFILWYFLGPGDKSFKL